MTVAIKERPILFSAPMVRALLDGSKTQTRRLLKSNCQAIGERDDGSLWPWSEHPDSAADHWHACPYGQPGDRLWVRETWAPHPDFPRSAGRTVYRADPECEHDVARWHPSIHMFRRDSRILLEIVSVRVERLNDCSNGDARAEGAVANKFDAVSPVFRYACLWDDINGRGSWNQNPWVWVVEFKRVTP
jgi:hypothetical protein